MAFIVSPPARWMTGSVTSHGWRRTNVHLTLAPAFEAHVRGEAEHELDYKAWGCEEGQRKGTLLRFASLTSTRRCWTLNTSGHCSSVCSASREVLREWFGQLVLYSNVITLSGSYVPFFDLGQGVLKMLGEIYHVRIKDFGRRGAKSANADDAGTSRCFAWPQTTTGRGIPFGNADELTAGARPISATECRTWWLV